MPPFFLTVIPSDIVDLALEGRDRILFIKYLRTQHRFVNKK